MATTKMQDYSAMTVNERLFEAGLTIDFDTAVRSHDRELIISLLTRVALSKEEAAITADTVLGNPKRYGL